MASAYPVMLHQSPSSYAGAPVGPPSHQPDMFSGSSLESAGDPSSKYMIRFNNSSANSICFRSCSAISAYESRLVRHSETDTMTTCENNMEDHLH